MLGKKIVVLVLVIVTSVVMIGCGGSGGSDGNAAIDKLIAYATTGEPIPTEQDYAAAGVVGVTDDNVASVNAFILGLLKEQVDTKEEVQALADEAGVTLAPRAAIVVSRNFAPKGGSIRFDGSSSADLDGSIVSYVWSREGQRLSTESIFVTTTLPYGTHIITLTVTDDDGNVGTATVQVRIEEINEAPVADAGPDQVIVLSSPIVLNGRYIIYNTYTPMPTPTPKPTQVQETVKLDGRMSADDGVGDSMVTYKWEVIQGSVGLSYADTATPSFVVGCSNIGVIILQLTVSDGTNTSTDTVKITVVDNNNVCRR